MLKHELKCVSIVQNHYYKEGTTIKFNLMLRSKGNIIVKDKSLSKDEEEITTKLYANRFPSQMENEYK